MSGRETDIPLGLVVSNSSPLIALATIGRLALLKSLFGKIAVPEAVFEEVVIQGQAEPGSQEVAAAEWIRTIPVNDQLAVTLLQESLDLGESEAIVLGQELGARYVLLDDELARRKADLLGLPVAGTLAVLLMAKQAGLIAAVEPVLTELMQTDFRMSERVLTAVLTKAGERDVRL
jgi:predicted nucleic acid-binding protein